MEIATFAVDDALGTAAGKLRGSGVIVRVAGRASTEPESQLPPAGCGRAIPRWSVVWAVQREPAVGMMSSAGLPSSSITVLVRPP